MALITCPECSRSISDQSTACPGCGHPTPRPVPTQLPQSNYSNNNSLENSLSSDGIQKNNGRSSPVFFILIVVFISYWLFDGDDDYPKETEQYSESLSQPYEEPTQEKAIEPQLVPIPMLISGSGENGRYFLISHFKDYKIENVSYLRKGDVGDSFGKMQIDCTNNKMRKFSTDNPDSLVSAELGDWHTPTPDWTDQDIVNFICK